MPTTYSKILLFLGMGLVILNPYTQFGPLGFYGSIPFIVIAFRGKTVRSFLKRNLTAMIGILCIGYWGVLVSYINDIPQFYHLYVSVSLVITSFLSIGVWEYCQKARISFDGLLQICLLVILLNSLIIALEFIFSDFRILVEGLLRPNNARDYSSGFRFRGIASSGGAGLSILIPLAIGITLYLYNKKIIGIFKTLASVALLAATVLVIGRTGLLLTAIPIAIFIINNVKRKQGIKKVIVFVVLFSLLFYFLYPILSVSLERNFGSYFLFYSHGFLEEGSKGFENEGTLQKISDYSKVLPLKFPYFFTGYGFYGGATFLEWTDSGIARMFMSVGFIFGVIYYFFYLKIIWFFKNKKAVFVLFSSLIVLIAAEVKEPLLFSQYAARLFMIMAIFAQLDYWSSHHTNSSILGNFPNKYIGQC